MLQRKSDDRKASSFSWNNLQQSPIRHENSILYRCLKSVYNLSIADSKKNQDIFLHILKCIFTSWLNR